MKGPIIGASSPTTQATYPCTIDGVPATIGGAQAARIGAFEDMNNNRYIEIQPWTPSLISTIGWYDASDSSTITESSGLVSKLADKSGNGYDLVQPSGSLQPEWGLGAQINGMNVLHFVNTLDEIEITTVLESLNSVAVVSVAEAKVSGDYPNCGTIHSTDNTDKLDLRMLCNASNGRISGTVKVDGVGGSIVSATNTDYADDKPFIYSGWYDGTNGFLRGNGGTLAVSNTPATGGVFNVNHIKMGRESNTPKNYHGEMIVIPNADIETIEKIEGYLAWKWGTQDRMDVLHPYRYVPPFNIQAAPVTTSTYLRPNGVDNYFRPDGTSVYLRP